MIYAQFYQMSVANQWNEYQSKPIEATGDRSVIILDGRNTSDTHHELARSECIKRGYVGYTLNRGESFSQSKPTSDYTPV